MSNVVQHLRSQCVGYLALFVALGGVSYAATALPQDSVGSPQLKDGQVKTVDLGKGSVTGAKVKNGSLRIGDFASGQVPRGPRGLRGPQGAAGSARAYGRIDTCVVGSPCAVLDGHNVTAVTHPFTGIYCVSVPGLTSADGIGLATLIDFSGLVQYIPVGSCSTDTFQFRTADPSANADHAFVFAIP